MSIYPVWKRVAALENISGSEDFIVFATKLAHQLQYFAILEDKYPLGRFVQIPDSIEYFGRRVECDGRYPKANGYRKRETAAQRVAGGDDVLAWIPDLVATKLPVCLPVLNIVRIPRKLDSRSTANWTPVPPQTGRLFQVKLDRRSEAPRGGDAVYAVMGPAVNARWRVPVLVGVGRGPSGGRRNVEKVHCCCAAGVLSQRCGPRGAVWAKGE